MKTSSGYVAVTATGEFLRLAEYRTHVGTRFELETVRTLDEATVQSWKGFGYGGRVPLPDGASWVPVEVRREVVLTGWGVAK